MLYSIHFLRFIAATSVVFYHASSVFTRDTIFETPIFAAGVDVFFVISGCVITLSTYEKHDTLDFIIRRFLRIFPIYWIATALYILFDYVVWKSLPSYRDTWHSILLFPNPKQDPWFPIYYPGWSLFYECVFYAIFASAFAFSRKPLIFAVVVITLLIFSPLRPLISRYCDTRMFVEFLFGLFIAIAWKNNVRVPTPIAILCLICACAMAVFYRFPGENWRSFEWGGPAVLFVIGMTMFEGRMWTRHPLAILLGNASYAIYLTHITTAKVISKFADVNKIVMTDNPLIYTFVIVCVAIAMGSVFHIFIEKPMLSAFRKLRLGSKSPIVSST